MLMAESIGCGILQAYKLNCSPNFQDASELKMRYSLVTKLDYERAIHLSKLAIVAR